MFARGNLGGESGRVSVLVQTTARPQDTCTAPHVGHPPRFSVLMRCISHRLSLSLHPSSTCMYMYVMDVRVQGRGRQWRRTVLSSA